MGRRKKTESEPLPQPVVAIGGNVSDETMREFERDFVRLKTAADEARQALAARCKSAAEVDGIDVKTFKQVQKLKALLPPEAEAKVHTFTRYTKQLGIFDIIEEYRQHEATADNAASVDAAERELQDAE